MNRQLVLVTGANGFVGACACQRLLAAGHAVRALVRPGRAAPTGCETIEAELLADRQRVAQAMTGVDAVLHLAALTHSPTATREEYWRTNVDGSRAVLEAARGAGVRRLAFLSSVKAVAEASESLLREDAPPRPLDAYGESKLRAEQLVLESDGVSSLRTSVLRIPMTYGPGMKGNILALFGLVNRGVPLPVGGVKNRRSIAYVDNVAAALLELLFHPAAAGEVFFCADLKPLSTAELITEIAWALGRSPRVVPAPLWLLSALSGVGDRMGSAVRARLGSAVVNRLVGSLAVDTDKLTRLTGYRPPFDTRAGMRAAARWYLSRGKGSSDAGVSGTEE